MASAKFNRPAKPDQITTLMIAGNRCKDTHIHLTTGQAGVTIKWLRQGLEQGETRTREERARKFRRLIEDYPPGTTWTFDGRRLMVFDYAAEYRHRHGATRQKEMRLLVRFVDEAYSLVLIEPTGLERYRPVVRIYEPPLVQKSFSFGPP